MKIYYLYGGISTQLLYTNSNKIWLQWSPIYCVQIEGICGPYIKSKGQSKRTRSDVKSDNHHIFEKKRKRKKTSKRKTRGDLIFAHLINHHLWRSIMDSAIVSCFSIRSCVQSRSSPLSFFLSLSLLAFATIAQRRFIDAAPLPTTVPTQRKKSYIAHNVGSYVGTDLGLRGREISFFRSSCSALYSRFATPVRGTRAPMKTTDEQRRFGELVLCQRPDARRTKEPVRNLSRLHGCSSVAWSRMLLHQYRRRRERVWLASPALVVRIVRRNQIVDLNDLCICVPWFTPRKKREPFPW